MSSGSGIFVYKMGSNKIAELDGQYALDDSESVGQWHLVKQNNVKPDLDSISGDNPADVPAAQDRWQ